MAEQVQRTMEAMVPELEEFRDTGIFSEDEVRSIVARRRDFEYQFLRRASRKLDFLRAVEYEMNLDKLRNVRKKRRGVRFMKLNDRTMQHRIRRIFDRALGKFGDDKALWEQYIAYCSEYAPTQLSTVFPRALAVHPTCPELWHRAGAWEWSQGNITGARGLFQRALRINTRAPELWWAFFDLEIRFIFKLRLRKRLLGLEAAHKASTSDEHAKDEGSTEDGDERSSKQRVAENGEEHGSIQQQASTERHETADGLLCGALPAAIFKNALLSPLASDWHFLTGFLERVPLTSSQQPEGIVDDDVRVLRDTVVEPILAALRKFSHVPECWDVYAGWQFRAQRVWTADGRAPCDVARAVYEDAVRSLPQSAAMWELYANFVAKQYEAALKSGEGGADYLRWMTDIATRADAASVASPKLECLRCRMQCSAGRFVEAKENLESWQQMHPECMGDDSVWVLILQIVLLEYGHRCSEQYSGGHCSVREASAVVEKVSRAALKATEYGSLRIIALVLDFFQTRATVESAAHREESADSNLFGGNADVESACDVMFREICMKSPSSSVCAQVQTWHVQWASISSSERLASVLEFICGDVALPLAVYLQALSSLEAHPSTRPLRQIGKSLVSLLIRDHGSDSADAWTATARYWLHVGDVVELQKTHRSAMRGLNDGEVARFAAAYGMLTAESR